MSRIFQQRIIETRMPQEVIPSGRPTLDHIESAWSLSSNEFLINKAFDHPVHLSDRDADGFCQNVEGWIAEPVPARKLAELDPANLFRAGQDIRLHYRLRKKSAYKCVEGYECLPLFNGEVFS